MQLELPLAGHTRSRLFTTPADTVEFLRITPLSRVPDSVWIETRALRLGCSISEIQSMRSYDRSRELAEEAALWCLGIEVFETKQPTRLNWDLIDAIAKREATERLKDFEQWRNQKR